HQFSSGGKQQKCQFMYLCVLYLSITFLYIVYKTLLHQCNAYSICISAGYLFDHFHTHIVAFFGCLLAAFGTMLITVAGFLILAHIASFAQGLALGALDTGKLTEVC